MNSLGKKVLVTGATGFVGGAFLARTASDGQFSLRAALRDTAKNAPYGIETVFVEGLTATANWREAVKGCDAVVHAAARVHIIQDTSLDPLVEFRRVNVEGTLNLARQAAEAGVKRFVFVSSVKVNGEGTSLGLPYTPDDLPSAVDPYGISKYEAERGLRKLAVETGMEVVIIRPPLVYGPGVKANFLRLLKLAQKGFPLPIGGIHNCRSIVYVGNLVSAIVSCLTHPRAAGETFLVSDKENVSTAELVRKMAFAMGRKATLLPIPLTLLKTLGFLTGKSSEIERISGSLCVDCSKLSELLDWQPPYTLEQGIQDTVDWYLSRD